MEKSEPQIKSILEAIVECHKETMQALSKIPVEEQKTG